MTISEATQLVIQVGALADKDALFLLDMGRPVRILDLAHQMIEIAGMTPGQDIALEFSSLRPGEKLREVLLFPSEEAIRSRECWSFAAVSIFPQILPPGWSGWRRPLPWAIPSESAKLSMRVDIDYTPSCAKGDGSC